MEKETKLNKASVILRGAGFVPYMFVHDWMSFNRYEVYLVGITILTTLYAGGEAFQQLHDLTMGDTRFEFLDEPPPSLTFTATVLFEKMVLQKGSVDGPQVLQMQLFTARNDQMDLMKEGNTMTFRNSKIDMFKGSMRLALDKWGRVEV